MPFFLFVLSLHCGTQAFSSGAGGLAAERGLELRAHRLWRGGLVPQPGIEPVSPALGRWGNPHFLLVMISLRCYFFSLSLDCKVLIDFFQYVFINEAVVCHRVSEPDSEPESQPVHLPGI